MRLPVSILKAPAVLFWKKVEKTNDCWRWNGYHKREYPRVIIGKHHVNAHRFVYMKKIGRILPTNILVHHLCRNKECVNPDHLIAISRKTHSSLHSPEKKEFCKYGHPYTEENSLRNGFKHGRQARVCRICRNKYVSDKRKSGEMIYDKEKQFYVKNKDWNKGRKMK